MWGCCVYGEVGRGVIAISLMTRNHARWEEAGLPSKFPRHPVLPVSKHLTLQRQGQPGTVRALFEVFLTI